MPIVIVVSRTTVVQRLGKSFAVLSSSARLHRSTNAGRFNSTIAEPFAGAFKTISSLHNRILRSNTYEEVNRVLVNGMFKQSRFCGRAEERRKQAPGDGGWGLKPDDLHAGQRDPGRSPGKRQVHCRGTAPGQGRIHLRRQAWPRRGNMPDSKWLERAGVH